MTETVYSAIVTGGTRGIGLSIARALQKDGFKVAAIYAGNETAAKKAEAEHGIKTYKLDVTHAADAKTVCARIENDLGPVGVLVNNAGITRDGFLHKMPIDHWHDVIATNLTSCFIMSQAVIAGMRTRGFGRIINISSINGQKGQLGQTNYAAAKAGMIGFTKALALESAAKGITVNVICPGYIETDMTGQMDQAILDSIVRQIPLTRMGKPEEIAAIVSFLASPNAAFMTGATLTANGGQYMV